GTPAFRLFDVDAGASLTLKSLTLQGGLAQSELSGNGPADSSRGGAVFNQGILTLNGVTLQNNLAKGGGSWWYFSLFPAGNGEGGAVYSSGIITVMNSTIANNSAIGGRGLNAVTGKHSTGGTAEFHPLPSEGSAGGDGLGGGLYVAGGTVSISD